MLDAELSKVEKPAGIANPKDFRNEVVKFCAQRPGQPWRQQSEVVDQLREAARRHRKAHVQPGRGSAAGDQLRHQEGQRDRTSSTPSSSPHGRYLFVATPSVRCAGSSSGTCGSTRPGPDREASPRRLRRAAMHFIDRRLNPKDKSARQPPALPAARPRPDQGSRSRSPSRTAASPIGNGGQISIPDQGNRRAAVPSRGSGGKARAGLSRQQGVRRRRQASKSRKGGSARRRRQEGLGQR